MNGTDRTQIGGVISALTRVGALLFTGWGLWFFQVMYRVTQLSESRLATVWEERIEALAFLTFPPNVSLLALAAGAAATATWLAGPTQTLGLAVLLRSLRWTCNVLVVIAVTSILIELISQPLGSDTAGTVLFRSGGVAAMLGISYLCLSAGRTAPGG